VFPNTFFGLCFVLLAFLTGGRARIVDGVVEAHGGFVTWLLARSYPFVGGPAAVTLGHVILGRNLECLDAVRTHEQVHVRQFEHWGPAFPFLYLGASLAALARGRQPYLDNCFERQARGETEPGS